MDAFSRTTSTTQHTSAFWSKRLLMHLAWFVVAAAFIGLLLLTYGLDLSAGFF